MSGPATRAEGEAIEPGKAVRPAAPGGGVMGVAWGLVAYALGSVAAHLALHQVRSTEPDMGHLMLGAAIALVIGFLTAWWAARARPAFGVAAGVVMIGLSTLALLMPTPADLLDAQWSVPVVLISGGRLLLGFVLAAVAFAGATAGQNRRRLRPSE